MSSLRMAMKLGIKFNSSGSKIKSHSQRDLDFTIIIQPGCPAIQITAATCVLWVVLFTLDANAIHRSEYVCDNSCYKKCRTLPLQLEW